MKNFLLSILVALVFVVFGICFLQFGQIIVNGFKITALNYVA